MAPVFVRTSVHDTNSTGKRCTVLNPASLFSTVADGEPHDFIAVSSLIADLQDAVLVNFKSECLCG